MEKYESNIYLIQQAINENLTLVETIATIAHEAWKILATKFNLGGGDICKPTTWELIENSTKVNISIAIKYSHVVSESHSEQTLVDEDEDEATIVVEKTLTIAVVEGFCEHHTYVDNKFEVEDHVVKAEDACISKIEHT